MANASTKIASKDRDSVKDMIRAAMSAPLLSPELEYELAVKWRDEQCGRALGRLTEAHMRMSVSAAIKFRGYGLPLGDMIQEGNIGLLEAAKRFDPDREVRFCTYAGWWIRASMQDYVLRNWSIVRIGSKSAHKTIFFNLGKVRAMIEDFDGSSFAANTAIAKKFKVTADDVEFMTSRLSGKDQSLNLTFGEESDTERQDMIADDRELPDESVEGSVDIPRRDNWIAGALGDLSDREQVIIKERFFSEDKVTLSSLGKILGLSKERVRQIEKQAIAKLRQSLSASEAGRGFMEIYA